MAPKGAKRRPAAADADATAKGPPAKVARRPAEAPSAAGLAAATRLAGALAEKGWSEALAEEFGKAYFADVAQFVERERSAGPVHPPAGQVFAALNATPLGKVRAVILGQDPYHEPGQAHGMCFSVPRGIPTPPSLKNMYKELEQDVPGFKAPAHGDLSRWAQQGVLLLNATLTVREGHKEANSHSKCGWQRFTDEVIRVVNARAEGVVFLLWGGFAQKKGKMIDAGRHRVIECAHPSPLSVTKWRGCRAFSRCNKALRELGRGEIDWSLPP